ncbi:hypothetical protein [Sphingomonas sp. NFX23]|uniref:hypothetical protein n=1 Tax=Sphingomonas sp. NFX23 TaxID=2819532 RepID=UPI003CF8689F
MAVALARQLLRTGAFTADDVRAMVAEMDEIAAASLDERPEAAKATQKGATFFRRALGNEPGVEFPFVLTAG